MVITQRYVHLTTDNLREASQSSMISHALKANEDEAANT
jgi:hypothetical protein